MKYDAQVAGLKWSLSSLALFPSPRTPCTLERTSSTKVSVLGVVAMAKKRLASMVLNNTKFIYLMFTFYTAAAPASANWYWWCVLVSDHRNS